MTDYTGLNNLATACPFIDTTQPICCGVDTAAIMVSNYQALDAVFFDDCPICAVNLKHMWCEYACNATKADFLTAVGITR